MAPIRLGTNEVQLATIAAPRSSTHSELVALYLAKETGRPQILTDHRTAMQLAGRTFHAKT